MDNPIGRKKRVQVHANLARADMQERLMYKINTRDLCDYNNAIKLRFSLFLLHL